MKVIAVTRAGRGDVYAFSSGLKADTHPIVQFGDAIMTSMDGLRQCLTMDECAMVAEKLEDTNLAAEIRECPSSSSTSSTVRYAMEKLWERLQQRAPEPPTDPTKILQKIIADRIMTRSTGIHLRPRGDFTMSEHQAAAAEVAETTTETAAAPAEAKTRPIPKDPKYADTSVISLLNDKDGKQYGADNNPKKVGSASSDRFAKYTHGMTVKDATDAGLIRGDLDNDVKKGYISIA